MLVALAYAVVVAAPTAIAATFGNTEVGTSTDSGVLANYKRVNSAKLTEEGKVTSLSIYAVQGSAWKAGAKQQLKAVIYSDSSGKPNELIATGTEVQYKGTTGWLELPFSSAVYLKAGTYWIGFISGTESDMMGFKYKEVSSSRAKNANEYSKGPSNPFGTFTTDAEDMSLYATYEAVKGTVVSNLPDGPAEPTGGWTVAYADGFGLPIGTGSEHDNTWYPSGGGGTQSEYRNPAENSPGSNANEMEAYNESQQSVTTEGLKLTCKYDPGVSHFFSKTQNYLCGSIDAPYCCHVKNEKGESIPEETGYSAPLITLGKSQTMVFQVVLKLPRNTGDADPAFWMDGPPYGEAEFDFPEFYGAGSGTGWETAADYFHWFASPGPEMTKWGDTASKPPAEPEAGFHTWTTEVYPGESSGKYRYKVYVDGKLQSLENGEEKCYSETCQKTESPEVTPVAAENKEGLILQYALRESKESTEGVSNGFKKSGEERSFYVKSVAVYEDKSHEGVGIEHGGVAPGTTVE